MSKHKFFTLLVIFFLLILTGCGSTNSESTRPPKTAFKGMELYSWQNDDGTWSFSILIGTNRLKSGEEVLTNPLDIDGVKEQLCMLALDEQVFWIDWELSNSNGVVVDLDIPPQIIVIDLIDHAAYCGVDPFVSLD